MNSNIPTLIIIKLRCLLDAQVGSQRLHATFFLLDDTKTIILIDKKSITNPISI